MIIESTEVTDNFGSSESNNHISHLDFQTNNNSINNLDAHEQCIDLSQTLNASPTTSEKQQLGTGSSSGIPETDFSTVGSEDQEITSISSERLSQKRIRDEDQNGDMNDSCHVSEGDNSCSGTHLEMPITNITKKKIIEIP
jgi:hypothetical protein